VIYSRLVYTQYSMFSLQLRILVSARLYIIALKRYVKLNFAGKVWINMVCY